MKPISFESFLAPFINTFVQYKRALNRKYCAEVAVLRMFDRYLRDHFVADWAAIDGALIDAFLRSRHRDSPASYNHLLRVVSRFFTFALMQEWIQRNPVTSLARRSTGGRIPYLFDLGSAKRLLAAARSLPDRPHARHRGLVYETIFALLYGLGLRVGEVSRLTLADIDLTTNLLFVRETKFAKSRIVPTGPQLAQRVKGYIEQRYGTDAAPELPLFSFTKRGGVDEGTISITFHALLPNWNCISRPESRRPDCMISATLLLWRRCFVGTGMAWIQ